TEHRELAVSEPEEKLVALVVRGLARDDREAMPLPEPRELLDVRAEHEDLRPLVSREQALEHGTLPRVGRGESRARTGRGRDVPSAIDVGERDANLDAARRGD